MIVFLDDDDGDDWWQPVRNRLILTDFEIGLQPGHVDLARRMLRGEA